ncbi:LOW QUALITY PROTEIN: hypothetical protein OSB04_029414 [Centaurea solstitialis]|uniref:Uncharacterized protein n=1 Tax=Centaurea solstitialis TaxID=347529 RepID=A0AA38SIC3_9ASTR|nr:LOW QUALITY PROTEIN: hypothetical protein OSB04_029414 [Centaurea solstitialis]
MNTSDDLNQHLKVLTHRRPRYALSHKCYFMGYKYHTLSQGVGHVTNNNEECVKGSSYNEVESEHGLSNEVLEIEYHSIDRCVIIDIDHGVKVDAKHTLVDVKYKLRLRTNDLFILASQAIQLKPRGIYKVSESPNEVEDDDNVDGEPLTPSTNVNHDLKLVALVELNIFIEGEKLNHKTTTAELFKKTHCKKIVLEDGTTCHGDFVHPKVAMILLGCPPGAVKDCGWALAPA